MIGSRHLPVRLGGVTRRSVFAAALVLFFAFSAQAAMRAAAAIRAHTHPAPAQAAISPLPAKEALSEAVPQEIAAPAKGTTGTIDLPALPVTVTYLPAIDDGTIKVAAPFSMRFASSVDRGRALDCLATAIYYEAASESDDGQRAVAQVILNRVRHPAFPATVCGVVYQGSERGSGCQFSYACDGAMARVPSRSGMARAVRIAAAALAGYVFEPVGLATHYHTYAVTPDWNRHLVMTAAIGAHFFHRWQGWWGTPAAFSRRYAGGEPIPGPHPHPASMVEPVPVLAAASAAAPSAPPPPSAAIQPPYAASGTPIDAPGVEPGPLPSSGQVLERWRDTGKPLR